MKTKSQKTNATAKRNVKTTKTAKPAAEIPARTSKTARAIMELGSAFRRMHDAKPKSASAKPEPKRDAVTDAALAALAATEKKTRSVLDREQIENAKRFTAQYGPVHGARVVFWRAKRAKSSDRRVFWKAVQRVIEAAAR